jgi:uncharacterized membrane protein YkvA (DUF1232 family)
MRLLEMSGMSQADLSRALVPVMGQERLVKNRFWRKVRKTLGRVPFIDKAMAAYFAAFDAETPKEAKAILLAALAYFIMPADVIPDVLTGLGFSDDATVLLMAIQAIAPHIAPRHIEQARRWLNDEAGASAAS